jgi:hypothetical protein
LKTKILALAVALAMVCATAQAATVTTLPLNYGVGISGRTTTFLVLGIADYRNSTGLEPRIEGTLEGGFVIPNGLGEQVLWHATTSLPSYPGGSLTANAWGSNTSGPPDFSTNATTRGFFTEDQVFSMTLSVSCFGLNFCADPPLPTFSMTFTTSDGVSIISTPIPAALPLFAAGLGIVTFLARRKKTAAARPA